MTKLLELTVKNVFPFKTATLDLDYEGITVIKGLNKDDGPKASNAAGKSRLVGAMADLVLDETPNGKDEKVKGKKSKRKQAVRVRLQKGKHEYQITKTVGKGKTYEIVKDGKSIDVRTVKYSQQKIKELFGLTETQFYTRFYIDGTIPHPLIVGSAAVRQDFIVELFNLNDIDAIRKLLNAELTAISKKAVEYRTIKRTLEELREDLLPKDKRQAISSRLEELKDKQERLSKELRDSQHISQLLTFERQNKPLLAKYMRLRVFGEVDPHKQIKSVKDKIADMYAAREAHSEWEHHDKHYAMWKDSWAPVKKELKKLGCEPEDIRKKVREAEAAEAMLDAQRRLTGKAGKEPEAVDEPKYAYDDCKIKVHQFKTEVEHARNFKSGRCTLCGSKVKARPVDEIKADLYKWVKRINACEEYDRYTKRYRDWKEKKAAEREVAEKVIELEATIEKLGKYKWVATLLEGVHDKPEQPEVERPTIQFDQDKLDKLLARKETLSQLRDVWETITELDALTPEKREKAAKAEKHVARLNEVMAEVQELTVKQAKQGEIIRRLKGLKSQAEDLAEECRDEKLLKALVGAYSTSGLKKFMIERYSKLLQEQVNKYRKMFFSEDYEFEFRYESGLKVLVHRAYGKRVESSDVRKLSGAEKRFFTLLLVVATNTMLPAKKRINVLILDEPESQMGAPAIERFIKTLGILRKLVPHIIVVTPKTDLVIEGSRGFTVVKHHGVSRLTRDATRSA